jgi:hypothetical protein
MNSEILFLNSSCEKIFLMGYNDDERFKVVKN